ncbi:MAG: redoxin family protein [Planctomycetota bacterium]
MCLGSLACVSTSDEKTEGPAPWQAGRISVAFFITTDCPIANAYAPEISKIASDHAEGDFDFYLVHVDPDLTENAAAQHASDYALELTRLFDRDHRLVKSLGVTVTPEVCIVGPEAELLYRGRIDDLFPALGKKRWPPRTRDLRVALEALAQDLPVPEPWEQAVGCLLPVL